MTMLLTRRNQNYNQDWLPSLFRDFMNDDWFTGRTSGSVPALNVIENEKDYELEFAVPGLKKEELNLQVDNDGVMSISMVSKQEDSKTDNKRNYIRREFSYQRINQSYILPDDADHKNIKAKVENGVLTINIPKVPAESQAKAVKNIAIE
jgi:HSP20 family protein